MLTPALQLLAAEHEVDVLTTTSINVTLIGAVAALHSIHLRKSAWEIALFCLLHYGRYDFLVGSAGISAAKLRWLARLLGADYIAAPPPRHNEHRIRTNVRAVEGLLARPHPIPSPLLPEMASGYPTACIDPKRINIGFSVGSKLMQSYKRWGIANFIALAGAFKEANTFFFVGPEEQEEKKALEAAGMRIVETSLHDTIACIRRLDLLIGNDNGLMHVGYAADIVTFTLFGMTNPKEIGGYGGKNHAVTAGLECQPCLDSAGNGVCRERPCLENLAPGRVAATIKSAMGWTQ